MSYTYTVDIGDGTKTIFPFSFAGQDEGYLSVSNVQVFVAGASVPFTIPTNDPNKVYLTSAPPLGAEVLIRRIMPKNVPYSGFSRGNPFSQDTLNDTNLQMLYVIQEILDGFLPDGFYFKGDLNMGGHKVINMAAGTSGSDAVNFSQLQVEVERNDEQDQRLEAIESSLVANVGIRTVPYYYVATGGETRWELILPFKSAILYINGIFQNQNLGAFSITNNGFNFAEPLTKGDEVYALLGSGAAAPDDYVTQEELQAYYDYMKKQVLSIREPWKRTLIDSGLNLVSGSFEEGATITSNTDALWYQSGGQCFVWGGSLPKVIPPNSTPNTTGGISPTAWSDVGNQTTLTTLAKSDGASKSFSKNAPVSLLLRRNIFEYMSKVDRDTITATVGVEVIIDYAIQAAINDGVMELHFPPVKGIYVAGQSPVTLPSGFQMTGVSSKPYTATLDTSFNNRGTVIRLATGASSIFILTNRNKFFNIIFDGRNKSVNLMKGVGSDQTQYCRFDSCGVYRWLNGFGGSSSSGYTATLQVIGCTIASNYRGVRNVIDSRFTDCTINANEDNGVELNSGANNNSFANVRNEWNGGHNWYAYGAKRNIVTGECCDRAGKNGFAAAGGGQWIIGNVPVQRSGRSAVPLSTDDAHFYIEGATSMIIITGAPSTTGADDGGSGTVTPTYLLAAGGNSSEDKVFIAAGSKLDGYSGTSWIRPGGGVAKMSITGCIGVPDTVNSGLLQVRNGKHHIGDSVRGATLSGTGAVLTMTFPGYDGDYAQYSVPFTRSIEITSRNSSTGSASRFFTKLLVNRESASASIYPDTNRVESQVTLSGNSWGLPSSSPTGVSVQFSISADAKTITVTLTSIDSETRIIDANLLP